MTLHSTATHSTSTKEINIYSKNEVFLNIAEQLSQLGTCSRKKVGAVITRRGRAISWGYNGAPPGLPHCEENNHGWHDELYGSDAFVDLPELKRNLEEFGCRNATHAEANALAFAARQGISTDGGIVFVTVSPCDVCAR